MENLKIRVNSEAESKEAQGLLEKLGFKKFVWGKYSDYFIFANSNYYSRDDISNFSECDYKEITLPELSDLVVLKRNDRKDANVYEENCLYDLYLTESKELYFYHCGKNKWILSNLNGDDDYYESLKPIKKPMKEYLRKNNDGEYILEVTDEREAQEPHAKHWIEVPKGCDYLISVFGVNSFIDSDMFAKFKTKNVLWSRKPMKEYLIKSGDGKYLLTHHDSIGAVEIPEGATYYAKDASLGKSGNFFFRLRSDDFDFEAVWLESNWIQAIFNVENQDVLWQRNNNQTIASAVESSHPEELPFIDDEPKIETATGYQLDVVGSNTYGSRSRYDGESDISYRQYLMNFIVGNRAESLNDQYAEIEKVRQSHRTASEIADSALKHIRERAETYDQPTGERSAAKTAKAFNAITGKDITESEVWLLLQLLKDVRQWSREDYHQDSAEDCIAYAALKAESLEGGE